MVSADDLREAASEGEIYRLLTAYVQALRNSDEFSSLPQPMIQLPVEGIADVGARVSKLLGEMDVASRRWDHASCGAIKQGIQVFASGLDRLQALRGERSPVCREPGSFPSV